LPILAETSAEAPLAAGEHLRRILSGTRPRAGAWIRACAVDALGDHPSVLSGPERRALLADDDALVRETAAVRWGEEPDGGRRLSVVDRVRVLRAVSIFREIDDEILADCASRGLVEAGEEVAGEDFRRSMYFVSEGPSAGAPGEVVRSPPRTDLRGCRARAGRRQARDGDRAVTCSVWRA
jgi:hypothetical protein